jgi:hypothetical protein
MGEENAMPFAADGTKYPCKVCNKPISNNGRAQASHMRMHARQEAWEEAEVEIFDEELVTHHANRLPGGKFSVEIRVIGHIKVGAQEFHWNKVLTIPLQRIDEETED